MTDEQVQIFPLDPADTFADQLRNCSVWLMVMQNVEKVKAVTGSKLELKVGNTPIHTTPKMAEFHIFSRDDMAMLYVHMFTLSTLAQLNPICFSGDRLLSPAAARIPEQYKIDGRECPAGEVVDYLYGHPERLEHMKRFVQMMPVENTADPTEFRRLFACRVDAFCQWLFQERGLSGPEAGRAGLS